VLEPLCRWVALSPQPTAFDSARWIQCSIQMAGDGKTIQHVQRLGHLTGDDLPVRLPPIAAHQTYPLNHLRTEHAQAPPECA